MNYPLIVFAQSGALILATFGALPVVAETTVLPDRPVWSALDERTPTLAKDGLPLGFSWATVNTPAGPRPLLFVAYRFPATFADRFSRAMPAPIFVTAVNRGTGFVYMRELTRDDDPPVAVTSPGPAPKSDWRVNGAPVEGPEVLIGGHVTINLVSHLGLPAASGTYDVFLWIDEFATEMQPITTGDGSAKIPAPTLNKRPEAIVSVVPAQVGAIEAAMVGTGSDLRIEGRSPDGPVTVLALDSIQRQIGWVHVSAGGTGDVGGFTFAVKVEDLVGPASRGQRCLAFVIRAGHRSRILDSTAVRR